MSNQVPISYEIVDVPRPGLELLVELRSSQPLSDRALTRVEHAFRNRLGDCGRVEDLGYDPDRPNSLFGVRYFPGNQQFAGSDEVCDQALRDAFDTCFGGVVEDLRKLPTPVLAG